MSGLERTDGGSILLDTCKTFGYADRAQQPVPLFATPPTPGQRLPALPDINYNHYNADMQKASVLKLATS